MSDSLITGSVSDEGIANDVADNVAEEDVGADINADDTGDKVEQQSDTEELIFGKYKDMDAAYNAFKELESMNGKLRREKKPEAPEEYQIDFSEDEDLKDYLKGYDLKEDPLFQEMIPAFKEANLTQEQAEILVKNQLKYNKSMIIDKKKEVEAVGADFDKMDAELSAYLSNSLDEATASTIKSLAVDAQSFQALHKALIKPSSVPTKAQPVTSEKSSEIFAKAEEMRNKENFFTNYQAQQQYRELMEKAIALEEKGM